MSLFSRIAGLPLEVEDYALDPLEQAVTSEFTRRTTVVRLRGGGEEGVGEDVTYGDGDQTAFQAVGAVHDLAGSHTFRSFSERVGSLDLFPDGPPQMPDWRPYRRWAFESAALDLALRQEGLALAAALEREPRPVRFVVSLRLGDEPTARPVERLLEFYPATRFKLDPTSGWDAHLVAELAALDAVDVLDLKGAYKGTPVDQPGDPELYRRVAEAFPRAWIEDPDLTDPDCDRVLVPHRDRITWDAPIHSVADVDALPFRPRMLNCKPSRFGSVHALFDFCDACAERGIGLYGGGQFELGPGRGQIQYLASLFHPEAPNDVAPGGYNLAEPGVGLPTSPLPPAAEPAGFRWRT